MLPSGSPGLLPPGAAFGSYMSSEALSFAPRDETILLCDCSFGFSAFDRAIIVDIVTLSLLRQEAVVGDFERFGEHLGRVEVEGGTCPAHRNHSVQRPFGDLLAVDTHRRDDRGGRLE